MLRLDFDVREMSRGDLDRYGGWTGKTSEATGFFRLEKDEQWWFVTPEGNAFLSFGINHLHPELWKQDYNREAWQDRLGLGDLNSSDALLFFYGTQPAVPSPNRSARAGRANERGDAKPKRQSVSRIRQSDGEDSPGAPRYLPECRPFQAAEAGESRMGGTEAQDRWEVHLKVKR